MKIPVTVYEEVSRNTPFGEFADFFGSLAVELGNTTAPVVREGDKLYVITVVNKEG